MNTQARGLQGSKLVQTEIETISGALAKLPNFEGPVCRGATFDEEWVTSLKAKMSDALFCDNGFLSSSNSLDGRVVMMHRYHNCHFFITSKTGKDICKFCSKGSSYKVEREVLFNLGTKFDVTSIEEDPTRDGPKGLTCYNIRMVEMN
jgi:hypothetical protein